MRFMKCANCNHKFCEFCHNADKFQKYENKTTHFDRIKSMSVEELAIFLEEIQDDALRADGCVYDLRLTTDWKEWLESEVEE